MKNAGSRSSKGALPQADPVLGMLRVQAAKRWGPDRAKALDENLVNLAGRLNRVLEEDVAFDQQPGFYWR